MPGQGSTLGECVVCNAQLNVACKTCKICKAEQPRKLRLKNKIENFDKKRESWVNTHMKNRTASHICDEGYILLEKLQALGVRAVLFVSKAGRKPGSWVSEVLAPRCQLSETSTTCLERMKSLYDIVIQECPHTVSGSQDFYPVKRVSKCKVMKGQKMKLVEWEPCKLCGKKWPLEWVPDKDTC